MNQASSSALEYRNLNALLIGTWERHGPSEVMDDGSEVVSYHTLMRRVMALSCFIDEVAAHGKGPVILYLPGGLWAVRCLLATWMTGRSALPIEAVAEARRGPSEHPQGRYVEPHRPHLDRLEERPCLVITLAPLARLAEDLLRRTSLETCPVLYANDISRMMDIGHQEKIRARLQPDWLHERAAVDESLPALWRESIEDDAGTPTFHPMSHEAVLHAFHLHRNRLHTAPTRFLSMTSIGKTATWTCSTLPCLAQGGRQSFIRFFHPRHVLDVLHRDRIDHLWMTPAQYSALAPVLGEETPPDRPVEYWSDAEPPEDVRNAFEAASGASLRWIDEAHR